MARKPNPVVYCRRCGHPEAEHVAGGFIDHAFIPGHVEGTPPEPLDPTAGDPLADTLDDDDNEPAPALGPGQWGVNLDAGGAASIQLYGQRATLCTVEDLGRLYRALGQSPTVRRLAGEKEAPDA